MRALAALLILIFVLHLGVFAEQLPEEKKLENIQQQLEESRKKLAKTKKEEQAVLGRLVVISKEIKETKQQLHQANRKIETNKAQIGTLSKELGEIQQDVSKKEKELFLRLREAYKNSTMNQLEFLISSQSVSEFLNRVYFFGKIVTYDADLLSQFKQNVYQLNTKKHTLQTKTLQIQELAKVITDKNQEMQQAALEKKKVYESLKQRRQEYEDQINELEKSSKDLESLILQKSGQKKAGVIKSTGIISWPLRGRITSRFGYRRHPLWGGRSFHTGLDIAAPHGSSIGAADNGEVIFSGWWDGYGKAIVIDHGKGITTVYGHMSRIYQQVGAVVTKGQTIGLVGSTGYSTGPHLHFEVRKSGKPVNPMGYLK